MKIAHLEITLIDDIVLSAHSATEGGHKSLSHIPGATLLGVVASKLYSSMNIEDAFAVFHSGKVRFGNGLPLEDAMRAAPMPLSFHTEKSTFPVESESGTQAPVAVFNLAAGEMPAKTQLKALRDGFVSAAGKHFKPAKSYRMKTAINASERRADEGKLFGYEALAAGQQFGAFVTADDAIHAALFERIVVALCGEVRLGRSRSAEYGRVRITKRDAFAPFPVDAQPSKVVLLAMSDLALVDAAGQPTLTLTGAALGLPNATVDFSSSFTGTRSYSPYNAQRRAHDIERHVIAQGSVITLRGTFTSDEIASLGDGVGIHREAGLGEVMVNVAMLSKQHFVFAHATKSRLAAEIVQPPTSKAGQDFIVWLRARDAGTSVEKRAALGTAKKWFDEFKVHQKSARRYLGLNAGATVGPSASQWSTAYTLGKNAKVLKTLTDDLHANIKPHAKGWSEQFVSGNGLTNFREWFLAKVVELEKAHTPSAESRELAIATIREFTKRCMDSARLIGEKA